MKKLLELGILMLSLVSITLSHGSEKKIQSWEIKVGMKLDKALYCVSTGAVACLPTLYGVISKDRQSVILPLAENTPINLTLISQGEGIKKDTDEDGVPDSTDLCPNDKEAEFVGEDGCTLCPDKNGDWYSECSQKPAKEGAKLEKEKTVVASVPSSDSHTITCNADMKVVWVCQGEQCDPKKDGRKISVDGGRSASTGIPLNSPMSFQVLGKITEAFNGGKVFTFEGREVSKPDMPCSVDGYTVSPACTFSIGDKWFCSTALMGLN